MPMRQDCKFFESRTYANGETVRKCDLDLAPEAPWRCPDDCPAYQRRLADVNWSHGTLVTPPTPAEPDSLGDESVAALLDAAEDIVNEAGPRVLAEIEAERARRRGLGRLVPGRRRAKATSPAVGGRRRRVRRRGRRRRGLLEYLRDRYRHGRR
ncbi:MAG: hypothetical protein D6683_05705 [Actinomyces sp.]|nr:MAG: hypothetical protein D6683_05705 [Actinomyces sp.]